MVSPYLFFVKNKLKVKHLQGTYVQEIVYAVLSKFMMIVMIKKSYALAFECARSRKKMCDQEKKINSEVELWKLTEIVMVKNSKVLGFECLR